MTDTGHIPLKPSHIVSAWSKEDGFCLGQKAIEEKSNEITAIPELLGKIQIKNQGTLYADVKEYFEDKEFLKQMQEKGSYKKTMEKAHSQIETREYYQTEAIFISSLKEDIELISRAVRGHWSIESMHWHLDVTFREDANTTIDKMAVQNLNIIRKWSLSILKTAEVSRHKLSMRKKRYVIGLRPIRRLEEVLNS